MFCTVEMSPGAKSVATSLCGKCGAKAGEPCVEAAKVARSSMNKLAADSINAAPELRK